MGIGRLVRSADRLAGRLHRAAPGITVLIYHRVGAGTDSAVDVPVDEFARQMAYLRAHHRVLDLDTAITELHAGGETTGVVVTFDDGTADFADQAVPVLADHDVPAALYVATHFVDSGEAFPWGAAPLSWPALAEACDAAPVTVGSHSHRHLLFDRIDRTTAADDIHRSIDLIATNLGAPPRHFAYPKALAPSAPAELVVRASVASAALAGGGANRAGCDVHRLRRTPVQRGLGPERFAELAAGGGRLEGWARRTAGHWRYRSATS